MFRRNFNILVSVIFFLGVGGIPASGASEKIRVAHFPNVTHAPALIARATRHFENRLGDNIAIKWRTFNAGPEAIEALFAGAIDILYVGPNPAINGFVRSEGDALRIIGGVASGGSGFVVRENSKIEKFEDLRGKRIASPQKGNTQDVALHHRMREKGLKSKAEGGDVEVFHISGGDQITALLKEQVDGLWTVEPWLARLVAEADGKILFEEGELWPDAKYATTVLVVRRKFLNEHRDLVQKWVKAHEEIIDWINGNDAQAKKLFNEEFERETGASLPPAYLDRFFSRIQFTTDPMEASVRQSARWAFEIGYLGENEPHLDGLFDLSFLKQGNR